MVSKQGNLEANENQHSKQALKKLIANPLLNTVISAQNQSARKSLF